MLNGNCSKNGVVIWEGILSDVEIVKRRRIGGSAFQRESSTLCMQRDKAMH